MEPNANTAIEDRIKQVLIAELKINPLVLTNSSANTQLLGRGIGLDSMETLALVAGVEQEFDIHIDDAELTEDLFKDLGTFTHYVEQKLLGNVDQAKGNGTL